MGTPVLTYSYNIYKKEPEDTRFNIDEKESALHLTKKLDPNFYGVIIFEAPNRLFTYEAGQHALSGDEVEELIEQITQYRDNPEMWLI